MMALKQIATLGRKLTLFLKLFAGCFGRRAGRELLEVYVKGPLADGQRKNIEAIALDQGVAPRTLQRFLESMKWDEEKARDTCQRIVAGDHAHPEAIGLIDESGFTKSGDETAGVGRQYNGNRGKIDNCVVAVHCGYSAPGFQVLLDSVLYLPAEFAADPARRKKHTCQTTSCFKPNNNWRSRWSIEHLATACECSLGHSTKRMAAIENFSMRWKSASRCSRAKSPSISAAG